MRNFRKLDIWKNGIEIVKHVYELTAKFPSDEKFGLTSQITRAAVSVPSNIYSLQIGIRVFISFFFPFSCVKITNRS